MIILGAGLDTCFHRILARNAKENIPHFENARFYEIDLDEVVELRRKFIPTHKNDINIACSILESSFLEKILEFEKAHDKIDSNTRVDSNAKNEESSADSFKTRKYKSADSTSTPSKDSYKECEKSVYIVIIAGVLMYFSKEEITHIATNIGKKLGAFELWCDVIGEIFSKQKIKHDTIKNMEASFVGGFNSDRDFLDVMRKAGLKAQIIQTAMYMRHNRLRWEIIGFLLRLMTKAFLMRFSFMLGLKARI